MIRCKIYRDKKKEEQLQGERQLEKLLGNYKLATNMQSPIKAIIHYKLFSADNESARMREAILDKSIAVLRQTYIKLVAKGNICGACSSDEGETEAKEEAG